MKNLLLLLFNLVFGNYNKNRLTIVCILFFIVTFTSAIKAQNNSIDGYWELTAEFPDYDINSTVRFKTSLDNTVEGITLGPTDGRDGSFLGKMSGDQLLLKTLGPQGEMQIKLKVSDNKILGTWYAIL